MTCCPYLCSKILQGTNGWRVENERDDYIIKCRQLFPFNIVCTRVNTNGVTLSSYGHQRSRVCIKAPSQLCARIYHHNPSCIVIFCPRCPCHIAKPVFNISCIASYALLNLHSYIIKIYYS